MPVIFLAVKFQAHDFVLARNLTLPSPLPPPPLLSPSRHVYCEYHPWEALTRSAGKLAQVSHDWFWFYF